MLWEFGQVIFSSVTWGPVTINAMPAIWHAGSVESQLEFQPHAVEVYGSSKSLTRTHGCCYEQKQVKVFAGMILSYLLLNKACLPRTADRHRNNCLQHPKGEQSLPVLWIWVPCDPRTLLSHRMRCQRLNFFLPGLDALLFAHSETWGKCTIPPRIWH